eukprot:jgi/Chlat1/5657/Chrsp37S05478
MAAAAAGVASSSCCSSSSWAQLQPAGRPAAAPHCARGAFLPAWRPQRSSQTAVSRRSTGVVVRATAADGRKDDDDADAEDAVGSFVGKWMARAKAGLPVVGLVSRLLAPEGRVGADYLDYSAFCRGLYSGGAADLSEALDVLEKRYGQYADSRVVLWCCWLGAAAAGVLPRDDLMRGASRLRASKDLGFEVESFNMLLEENYKKKSVQKRLASLSVNKRVDLAVEIMKRCVFPSAPVSDDCLDALREIVSIVFKDADAVHITQSLSRLQKAGEIEVLTEDPKEQEQAAV